MMAPSTNKVAIVTGASSGMGTALTIDLTASGWTVAMFDLRENPELSAQVGDRAFFVKCDVSDYDSQAVAFQTVFDRCGRIDVLCANAGIVDRGSIFILNHRNSDTIPPKPDLLCTDIDYKGVVYGTQLAIHFMRKNPTPGGKIIATASIAAIHPHETYPEYDGAKAAVVNFARAVAPVIWIKDKITMNCVLPGIVRTSIIPPEMVAAVSADCLTPVSTIVAAYRTFIDDEENKLNGQALEGSCEKLLFVKFPEYNNGKVTERAVTVWDPLFEMNHGEKSGLPNAIP